MYYKKSIIAFFVLCFLWGMIALAPSTIVGSIISKYSNNRIELDDPHGTLWDGDGIIVVKDADYKQSSAITKIHWVVNFSLEHLIGIDFFSGNTKIASTYMLKNKIYVDNLNISLSIFQISQLFDIFRVFALSGNLGIHSSQLILGNSMPSGSISLTLNHLGSEISPVNPLGDYTIKFDLRTNAIEVNSSNSSTLYSTGSGNINNLNINATIKNKQESALKQFMSTISIPNPNGSYTIKVI